MWCGNEGPHQRRSRLGVSFLFPSPSPLSLLLLPNHTLPLPLHLTPPTTLLPLRCLMLFFILHSPASFVGWGCRTRPFTAHRTEEVRWRERERERGEPTVSISHWSLVPMTDGLPRSPSSSSFPLKAHRGCHAPESGTREHAAVHKYKPPDKGAQSTDSRPNHPGNKQAK